MANEGLEGGLVDFFIFVDVNRAANVSVETPRATMVVSQARRFWTPLTSVRQSRIQLSCTASSASLGAARALCAPSTSVTIDTFRCAVKLLQGRRARIAFEVLHVEGAPCH